MILRLSSNAQRAVVLAVSLAVALILSYFSIRNAFAAHDAGLQTAEGYERAVHLEPANFQNWYLLGRYWQYNLENPDVTRAMHAYLSALSFNPASSETWLDLATAYESEGNLVAARDAFLHAKKVYPLSSGVSWRYGNFLLRQGELDPAFREMRLAVVADPRRAAEAFSRALRSGSSIETTIDRVLPPITEAYLDVIRDQTTDGHTENALTVWNRMASFHPRISLSDSFSLVNALRAEKHISDASRVWDQAALFAGLADLQSLPGSVLWDGGFESSISGGGFSWLFSQGTRGVQVGIDTHEKRSGNSSLRLIFDGRSNISYLDGVCHYVPVKPSTAYLFSAWIKTRALTSGQGLRFRLNSLDTQYTSTANTSEIHGTAPWTRIQMPWTSAGDVHEVQVCLVRFSSDEPENKIQGTAWVDDVALIPEPAEHPRP
jgi:tetratricopeptide (TPR) repeat protein